MVSLLAVRMVGIGPGLRLSETTSGLCSGSWLKLAARFSREETLVDLEGGGRGGRERGEGEGGRREEGEGGGEGEGSREEAERSAVTLGV